VKTLKGYKVPKLDEAILKILVNGQDMPTGQDNALQDWAEATPVRISVELSADFVKAREQCDLGASSKIGIYVSARSSGTGLRVISSAVEGEAGLASSSVEFEPHMAGGTLSINVYLVVIDAGNELSSLAPSTNDILSEWQTSVHLEGDDNRAGVYFKDFQSGHKKCLWEIELTFPLDDDEWTNLSTNSVISVAVNKDFFQEHWDQKYTPYFLKFDYLWALIEAFADEPNYVDTVFMNFKDAPGSFIKHSQNLLFWLFESDDSDTIKRLLRDKQWLRSQMQSKLAKQVGF
jgi:hypothetical protein